MSESRLRERVAIVTGGGRGIGRATAERLAREGARVLIATRTAEAGEAAAAAIRSAGGDAAVLPVDIGEPDAPRRAVEAAVARWNRLDIVVHNAAHVPYGLLSDLPEAEFSRAFDTNVTAGLRLLKHALPHLEAGGNGRLILTSSVAARGMLHAGLAAYSTSKAALEGFVRGAAIELAPRGITVNAVAPGATRTPAMRDAMSPAVIAALETRMPMQRIGSSEDVAAAMAFLASDDGAYVTGHVLLVDGAQSLSFELEFDQITTEI
ncbi:MAG: SDR family oxidoreductase [Gluconacetobacter diazotrophicus]|nr:SDR family oxidoreductase [Gluconacetobacter diazotrophicus]